MQDFSILCNTSQYTTCFSYFKMGVVSFEWIGALLSGYRALLSAYGALLNRSRVLLRDIFAASAMYLSLYF